jgi:hypothetical protein
MIDLLVDGDIYDIRQELANGEVSLIEVVLRGLNGWKPYNQLTDKELIKEFKARELE